jgi:zinc protease
MIAISGDFDRADMKKKLEQAFAAWPRGTATTITLAPAPELKEKRLFYIQKPINQTQIRVGYPGFARHSPDQFAWDVFNEIWGGGGTSRLFRTVRTRMGLAYAVGSASFVPAQAGFVIAVSQSRGSQAISAARAIRGISDELRAATFDTKEVQAAKDTIINAYVQNFTSSAQIAAAAMSNEYFGYPADYLETYPKKIAAVTPADIQRVARAYLQPDKETLFFVGDLSTFEKPLSTLGKPREVRPIDYTLPRDGQW